jgi:hypothetical protein
MRKGSILIKNRPFFKENAKWLNLADLSPSKRLNIGGIWILLHNCNSIVTLSYLKSSWISI